jgi:hypothetical protein
MRAPYQCYCPFVRRASLCVVAALVGAPGSAFAGRTFYGWLYGTEVMPERGVELQTWVLERDGVGNAHSKETDLWLGPLVGVTDQLELALPIEMGWIEDDATKPEFTLTRYGVEARYRLVTQDPVDAPPFAPLVRVAVKRDVTVRDATIIEGDIVASYQSGRLHALADVGVYTELSSTTGNAAEVRPGAGVSIQAIGDLRVGAEVYAEIDLDSAKADQRWIAAGPDLAWTHGRFWLSAAYGIGIVHITAAPRVMWGVAF